MDSLGDVFKALRRTVWHWINLTDKGKTFKPNLLLVRKMLLKYNNNILLCYLSIMLLKYNNNDNNNNDNNNNNYGNFIYLIYNTCIDKPHL